MTFKKIRDLTLALNKARKALKEYGDHKVSCATNAPPEDFGYLGCSCGLYELQNLERP